MNHIIRWPAATALACLLAACGGNDGGQPSAAALQQVLRADIKPFTGNGTWWNPAEGGSGFVFEAQGSTGVVTYFTYAANGKPEWYSGAGAFTLRDDGKYAFSAALFRYSGGQPAGSAAPKTPVRSEIGATTIVFDGDTAQVQIPGRSYSASKFNATSAAGGTQPEAGIYWNAGESGRGYTMEVANNIASIGVFHYDDAGNPTWNLVVGDMSTGKLAAPFTSYTGGQPFGGSYRAPTAVPTTQQFQANFAQACQGTIQLPGMASTAVTRFPFGGLPAGGECRSSQAFQATVQLQQQELSRFRPPDYHLDGATLFCEVDDGSRYDKLDIELSASGVLRLRFHEADGPNDQIEVAYNAGDGSVSFAGDDGWERLTGENFRFEHRSAWSFKGTLSASRAFDGTLEEISATRWDRDATVRECKRTIRLTGKP